MPSARIPATSASMSAITKSQIPNRNELVAEHEEQARLYLRQFDPKRYSTFYKRVYDAEAYLEQVGINTICELIEQGNNILNIAKKLDISTRTLRIWISKSQYYRTQVQEAYRFAGDAFAFKAEQVLLDARGTSKENTSLASKLSDHYRWMATKLDREQYGESKQLDPNTKAPLSINLNFGGEAKIEEKLIKAESIIAPFLRLQEE